jgi:hypothetical protein
MSNIPDDLLSELGSIVLGCITNPEKFDFLVEEYVVETGYSEKKAAVILFTAYSWYISNDLSLKDFHKHWLEDYINVD